MLYKIFKIIHKYEHINNIVIVFCDFIFDLFNKIEIKNFKYWKIALFLIAIGAEKVKDASSILNKIEEENKIKIKPELIKKLYLALIYLTKKNGQEKEILTLLEKKTNQDPYVFWVWRNLIDINFFSGNLNDAIKHHNRFLIIKKNYMIVKNIPSDVKYYGEYTTNSIGHTLNLWIYYMIKKLNGDTSKKDIILFKSDKIANLSVLNLFEKLYEIKDINGLKYLEGINMEFIEEQFNYLIKYQGRWCDIQKERLKIYKKWSEVFAKPPWLKLSLNTNKYGQKVLREHGILENDWYVVIHVKQSMDKEVRNCNIFDYLLAISEIINRGGWVFRIGDDSMPALPKIDRLIDLSQSKKYNNDLHLFLLGTSKFAITTTSGPSELPGFFKIPSIHSNAIFLRHVIPYSKDIIIPVRYYNKKDNSWLNFDENMDSKVSETHWMGEDMKKYQIIYNTKEEIYNATIEMFEILDKNKEMSDLQKMYQKKFLVKDYENEGRFSHHFLEKNKLIF